MPKEDLIEFEGYVDNAMGGGWYSINIDGGTKIRARLSGKMRNNHIQVLPSDRVKVAVSPYDLTHGMITYRSKK